jgi:iron complex outermembrane receptor protein
MLDRYQILSASRLITVVIGAMIGVFSMPQIHAADENQMMEEVVTIGTRVAGRTATDSAAPIDVFNADVLAKTGESEVGPLLQKIAPSFNFSRTTIGDGTDLMRPATLRGMGPDQVLILVNGKRRHSQAWVHIQQQVGRGTSGTDLNAIPIEAIERIEVLRDGAAAQYGSDAIAGVINIILKDRTDETRVSARTGGTTDGDGDTVWVSANTGFDLGADGFINLTAEYSDTDRTEREGKSSIKEREILRLGSTENDNYSLWFNAGMPLGSGGLYAFGGMSEREGVSGGFYRFETQPDRSVPQVYPDGFLPLQTTSTEDRSIGVGWRSDILGDWTMDASIVYGENEFGFGVKNSINASIAAEYFQNNPLATDAEIAANAGPTSGDSGVITFEQTTYNLDVTREYDMGPDHIIYVAAGFEFRDEEYSIGMGDPASFSCGLSSATPVAFPSVIDPTAFANCGFQGFPGYGPATAMAGNRDRDATAIYADMESNITESLLLGLAVRYETYSDAGDETTGKLSFKYDLTDDFSLRAVVSTGFRAPGLAQRSFTTTITDADAEGLRQTFHAPEGHPIPVAYGVDSLSHETSNNISAGFIFEPTENVTMTLDLYSIEVLDRVVLGGGLDGSTNETAADLLATDGLDSAQFFSNAIDTTTHGADFVTTYDMMLNRWGELTITGTVHFNTTEVDRINAPEGVDIDTIFAPAQVDLVETGQPRERFNLSFDWDLGNLSTTVRLNYYGEVETSFWTCAGLGIPTGGGPGNVCADDLGLSDAPRIKSDGKFLTDIEVRYYTDSGLNLILGVNNVTDERPDKLADNAVHRWISDASSGFGNFIYPWESTPFGTDGAFYYLRAEYTLSH